MAFYTVYTGSTYTYDITKLFEDRLNDLRDAKWKAEERIDIWAKLLQQQIFAHAKEQKDLLQCYFNERQNILLEKKKEMIEEMRKFERNYDYNQMSDLLEQCRTLKFELLVEFTEENQPTSFIQCMTKEDFEQKKKIESSATKTGNYTSEAKSELKTGRDLEKYIDSRADLTRDPTSTTSPQTT
jgi:hypothetical protein